VFLLGTGKPEFHPEAISFRPSAFSSDTWVFLLMAED
jgi:hypothetical protein